MQPPGVVRADSGASYQQEVALSESDLAVSPHIQTLSAERVWPCETKSDRNSLDQQIVVNLELPAELRLNVIYHGCLTSGGLLEHGGSPTGAVDGEPNYVQSSSLATSSSSRGSRSCSGYGRVIADGRPSDCVYLNDTCRNGGQVGMNTADGSLTVARTGGSYVCTY